MKKIWILIIVLILIGSGAYYFIHKKNGNSETQFEFTSIKRGNVENLVSCTGTLEAVGAVEVGSELSGTVSKVYVNFNDNVKKDQVLAILDTTQLSITLRNAKAEMIRAEAQYELSKVQYENDQKLYENQYISRLELKTSETSMKSNYVNLLSAQANLDKVELNINKYSIIRSPIDGKVINRSIEEGQTVAASFSSPTLFYIAKDLSKMEIYAFVDESDIGQIYAGMKAVFTVEAYSEEEFSGTVKQIRLQPETISNVVNYTVIVEADNRDNLLLPGMTATIDFIIEQKKDVLLVANSALSFTPDQTLIAQMIQQRKAEKEKSSVPNQEKPKDTNRQNFVGSEDRQKMFKAPKLWYPDEAGNLQMTLVQIGSTDGMNTELTDIGNLKEGMQVITKQKTASKTTTTNSNNNLRMMRPF
ncbi:MAG: efflux RND transporter periplasmic adaptor subunit [Candidatus Cloacimonadales bacterium]|nr:efflux RND transporter periplasmic adaptor subunit [Candidatus Cloacimonadales bacterium]